MGGNCGTGALAAVAGKVTTIATGGDFAGTILAGGVGSVVGGRKFANGALTAAFGYLFNCLQHPDCSPEARQKIKEIMADLRNPIDESGCVKSGGLSICVGPGAIENVGDRLLSTLVRTEARNLAEQLTIQEAQAGAGQRIMQGQINDPRFPGDEWAKMQHVHETPSAQNIVIHYWERLRDSFRTGFKFKD